MLNDDLKFSAVLLIPSVSDYTTAITTPVKQNGLAAMKACSDEGLQ